MPALRHGPGRGRRAVRPAPAHARQPAPSGRHARRDGGPDGRRHDDDAVRRRGPTRAFGADPVEQETGSRQKFDRAAYQLLGAAPHEPYLRRRFAASAAAILSTNSTSDTRNALCLIAANARASRNERESDTSPSNDCDGSAALVPRNNAEIGISRIAASFTRRLVPMRWAPISYF